MYVDSEQMLDSVFLSYNKILKKLHLFRLTTEQGKEITELDFRKAIDVILENILLVDGEVKRYYILDEGNKWLRYVYFQNEKKQIDADVEFFENRIKQYEELLKLQHNENWWNEDMTIKQLEKYFNRSNSSIKKAIRKMCDNGFSEYKYFDKNKVIISNEGVKWLCKNVFKQKYLRLLEKYKMQLTEMYIKAGYIYDEFFEMN